MTVPTEDVGDSSPLASPVGSNAEAQVTSFAEVLERSNLLLDALRLSDNPSDSGPTGNSSTINPSLLQRHQRPLEEEAKDDIEPQKTAPKAATTGTSTTLPAPVPDNVGQNPSPNGPHPSNDSETTGPFHADLIDEDEQQRRRPLQRSKARRRARNGDESTSAGRPSISELLVPRVSERHVSAYYENIMSQVYLLEEQEENNVAN